MAGLEALIEQLKLQNENSRLQNENNKLQMEELKKQNEALLKMVMDNKNSTGDSSTTSNSPAFAIPSFSPFDPAKELWVDYLPRFETFCEASAVPDDRRAKVFLTNQTPEHYRLLTNLATQQATPKKANELTFFMATQFDAKKYVVHRTFSLLEGFCSVLSRTAPQLQNQDTFYE